MVAEKGAIQGEQDDLEVARPDKPINSARGYYGRALREGRARQPQLGAARRLDTVLRVLNLIGWLVLLAFMTWRVYLARLAENT